MRTIVLMKKWGKWTMAKVEFFTYEGYRAWADQLGLSDYRVAKISGVSKQCISDFKCQKCNMSAESREKIAQALCDFLQRKRRRRVKHAS